MPWPCDPHVWVLTHRGGHHPQCAWVGMCGQQNAVQVPMSYFQTQSINDTATSALSPWIMCSGGSRPLCRGHSAWRRGSAGQGTAASANSQHQPASHGGSTGKQNLWCPRSLHPTPVPAASGPKPHGTRATTAQLSGSSVPETPVTSPTVWDNLELLQGAAKSVRFVTQQQITHTWPQVSKSPLTNSSRYSKGHQKHQIQTQEGTKAFNSHKDVTALQSQWAQLLTFFPCVSVMTSGQTHTLAKLYLLVHSPQLLLQLLVQVLFPGCQCEFWPVHWLTSCRPAPLRSLLMMQAKEPPQLLLPAVSVRLPASGKQWRYADQDG